MEIFMNEKAIEWAVEIPENKGHKLRRILSLLIAVIIFIFYTMTGIPIGLIGVIVFACISGWLQMNANVEYVCYYTNEVLEITPLYNRVRHGKKITYSINEIEYLVKGMEVQEITKYFCKKESVTDIYTLVVQKEGRKIAVVLETVPAFIDIMKARHKV